MKQLSLREKIMQLLSGQQYRDVAKLGKPAVEILRELIDSTDTVLAAKAVHAASYLKPKEGAVLVDKAAQSRRRILRVAAAIVAPRLKKAGTPILERLLRSTDASVQKWAIRAANLEPPTTS